MKNLFLKAKNPQTAGILTIIFLILLPPAFFWRETLGRATLGDQDALFYFFPAYRFVAEQIRSGELPLWTNFLYSGSPFYGAWHAGTLNPINWIYLFGTTSKTLTFSLEISFVISLLSTFAYCRIIGFQRRSSIIAAIVYALSGFAVGRTLYPGLLHSYALAPLVLYFIEKLSRSGRWRDMAFGSFIFAWQIFASHPQPLLFSTILAFFYGLFKFRFEIRSNRRFLLQFLLMFLAGAGLAAVQWIPAWEIAGQSIRREWSFDSFTAHSIHPVSLLTTLFPFFHGSGKTIYQLPFWGVYWHHNEAQIYLGVIALALAIAGALAAARERYRTGLFWSLVGTIGLILALGKYSRPVAEVIYQLPLINQFRSPNRHWMEVALAAAVLAGYAIDRLLKGEEKLIVRDTRVTTAILTLLCCLIGGLVLWRRPFAESVIRSLTDLNYLPAGFLQAAGAEFYLPVATAICSLVVLLIFTRSTHRNRWFGLLLAILLIDYNLYAAFAPINNQKKLELEIGRAMPPSLAAKQSEREPIRYHLMLDPATGEFSPLSFYGQEMATGYDPMLNGRYKTFSGIDEAGRSYLTTMLEPQDRTLDILNVRYILIPQLLIKSIDTGRWREVSEGNEAAADHDFRIFENLRYEPRVWLVDRVEEAYEGDQLKLIRGEKKDANGRPFDPRKAVLVEPIKEPEASWYGKYKLIGEESSPEGTAKILERSHNRMQIETDAPKPSILVLSEPFYPGWKVRVDGNTGAAYQVNYMLRAVPLPEGKHKVEFFYRPDSLIISATISIITAFCLFFILGFV
ncbi:MAG: YfhO family protein [Acidobacteria bacterium]|nr:YfhO family protein [Acidobacteriota bacterium]